MRNVPEVCSFAHRQDGLRLRNEYGQNGWADRPLPYTMEEIKVRQMAGRSMRKAWQREKGESLEMHSAESLLVVNVCVLAISNKCQKDISAHKGLMTKCPITTPIQRTSNAWENIILDRLKEHRSRRDHHMQSTWACPL
jgi:hypothetical protein